MVFIALKSNGYLGYSHSTPSAQIQVDGALENHSHCFVMKLDDRGGRLWTGPSHPGSLLRHGA